ncbi:MAG: hypothetical protein U5Q44_04500 [Dehalococcoidia bacterium]|nr:hypothetical protein [Dehalococcoidia bacterium]
MKSNGPGSFVSGQDTTFDGHAAAETFVQSNCLTEVVFESEDEGQVDVELFIEGSASSKFAFVICYMKLENIDLRCSRQRTTTLRTATTTSTGADWTPATPVDVEGSSTDSSNVSEDVLVRARVEGWFTNSNPSGRARDESNPDNILPADRWVMPEDWSRVIAGTTDPDVAYDRRPAYDYMFDSGQRHRTSATRKGFSSGEVVEDDDDVRDLTTDRPFVGPYSLVDVATRGVGVAPYLGQVGYDDEPDFRDTSLGDGQVDWWDAPMPVADVQFDINGSGFLKEVLKKDVYYTGEPNGEQVYPNAYYYTMIPGHPDIPARAAGGGYDWASWTGDGAYEFWSARNVSQAIEGDLDGGDASELQDIRDEYGDPTINRQVRVYSDNHGEAFVVANGDFNLDYADCDVNLLGGGWHCDQGDVVGNSSITATAD